MEQSIQFAKKYLEDILSFFGLNTDVHATSEDEVINLSIPSTHMNGFLIGQRGETLRAIQYMVSAALMNNNHEYHRVNVDVADYKKNRQEQLSETVKGWIEKVRSTKEPMQLKPMNAADRRIVHKVADENGIETESVGEGRDRHVVLKPAPDKISDESEE